MELANQSVELLEEIAEHPVYWDADINLLSARQLTNLLSVLSGEKPVGSIGIWVDSSNPHDNILQDFLELSDIEFNVSVNEGETVDETQVTYEFSLEESKLNADNMWERNDREIGRWLGYPESAIDAFCEDDSPEAMSDYHEQLVEAGEFSPAALAWSKYVMWKAEMSVEGVKRSVEAGKERHAKLSEFAKKNNLQKCLYRLRGSYWNNALEYCNVTAIRGRTWLNYIREFRTSNPPCCSKSSTNTGPARF